MTHLCRKVTRKTTLICLPAIGELPPSSSCRRLVIAESDLVVVWRILGTKVYCCRPSHECRPRWTDVWQTLQTFCVCACECLRVPHICTILLNNSNVNIYFSSRQQVFNSKCLFHVQARIRPLRKLFQVSAVAHLAWMMLYPVLHGILTFNNHFYIILDGTIVGMLWLPSSVNNWHLQAHMYKHNSAVRRWCGHVTCTSTESKKMRNFN